MFGMRKLTCGRTTRWRVGLVFFPGPNLLHHSWGKPAEFVLLPCGGEGGRRPDEGGHVTVCFNIRLNSSSSRRSTRKDREFYRWLGYQPQYARPFGVWDMVCLDGLEWVFPFWFASGFWGCGVPISSKTKTCGRRVNATVSNEALIVVF